MLNIFIIQVIEMEISCRPSEFYPQYVWSFNNGYLTVLLKYNKKSDEKIQHAS
jgi:hypothetical protein